MKVGEKVQITDLSYARIVNENGELEGIYGAILDECWKTSAILVAKDCLLPDHNTVIVQICKTGRLVFTCKKFLEPFAHTLVLDGKEITISDKSYRELKQHFTE